MRGRRLPPSKREFRTARFIQHKRYVGAGEFLIAGLLLVDPAPRMSRLSCPWLRLARYGYEFQPPLPRLAPFCLGAVHDAFSPRSSPLARVHPGSADLCSLRRSRMPLDLLRCAFERFSSACCHAISSTARTCVAPAIAVFLLPCGCPAFLSPSRMSVSSVARFISCDRQARFAPRSFGSTDFLR